MCMACDIANTAGSDGSPDLTPFANTGESRYDGTGKRSPQWWPSRYGADDELGAGNELTPERTLEAIQLVREGRIIELARVLDFESPTWSPPGKEGARWFRQVVAAHGQMDSMTIGPTNNLNYMEEHVSQIYHIGTHLDGFGHIGIEGRYYNGTHYPEFYAPAGLNKFGIHNVKPWVTRGVLLNIAAVVGVEMLTEGFVITPEHLERACELQNVEVRHGDAVLLHTGYGALWMVDNERYNNDEPGIGWDAAHWLTDRRVSLIGADTWAVEVLPGEVEGAPFVVHQHTLTETGTHLLENVKTEALVETGRSEFLFILSPVKTRGSTASMVNPLVVL